ncbi:response regulator transcription factor [Polaromonas sp. SM01]|uniref:response regulator transcription factor n=1 Tax=Polaromonas sp. SM01 TaxID=3085630 RepID=UPI00298191E7|nr:response regulator transcription factor [Polaromonas sp. SM01]MDW5441184.1 response regulator transcription factor [Polaromonas sp. SM01]
MKSVFVLDDHDIVRFGLETLIASYEPSLRLVGAAANLATGLRQIGELRPDLVISDMSLGESKGLDTVAAVVQAQGHRPVLVVSMHDELIYAEQVLALGAKGYVMKENAHATVVPAAFALLRGETWVSPKVNARMLNRVMKRSPIHVQPGSGDADVPLSAREVQVLEKLRNGKTTKEIAFVLGLSSRTIDVHRANIKRKLRLKSGSELIAFAITRM